MLEQQKKYVSKTTKGIYKPLEDIFRDGEKIEKMSLKELLEASEKMNEIELQVRAQEAEAMFNNDKFIITGIKH
ncbi:hypothetical protein [Polaribacter sp.]|uniref:hypothetical protein n=1 Tax=Polaribacter sp. TaxID=1920175 RepID=UPI003F6CE1F9